MYAQTIPPLTRSLTALSAILSKAEAHCTLHKINEAALVNFRLYPDMLPFTGQVQLTCDFAARAAARLSGSAVPSFADTETTFATLGDRIAAALASVGQYPAAAFDDAATRQITMKMRGEDVTLSGEAYLTLFALPNFYFHATTAYVILRHNGVPLGKMDFMGV